MHRLHAFVDRLGKDRRLDGVAEWIAGTVGPWFEPRAVKNALSGTWLGHRLHPLLTDTVIGTWASAGLLDVAAGKEAQPAVRRLLGAGLVASLPTAAAGLSDYADLHGDERRIAVVHALAADTAVVLQTASLIARRRGHTGTGRLLSLAALGVLGAVGYVGGHLSYVLGVGVDRTAFHEGPDEWTDVASSDAVTQSPVVVHAAGNEVLLVRRDGRVLALDNRCNHAGCALHEGKFDDDTVVCGCHGSTFRLADGAVERGPAASPQLRYEVRESDGRVQVRAVR